MAVCSNQSCALPGVFKTYSRPLTLILSSASWQPGIRITISVYLSQSECGTLHLSFGPPILRLELTANFTFCCLFIISCRCLGLRILRFWRQRCRLMNLRLGKWDLWASSGCWCFALTSILAILCCTSSAWTWSSRHPIFFEHLSILRPAASLSVPAKRLRCRPAWGLRLHRCLELIRLTSCCAWAYTLHHVFVKLKLS